MRVYCTYNYKAITPLKTVAEAYDTHSMQSMGHTANRCGMVYRLVKITKIIVGVC